MRMSRYKGEGVRLIEIEGGVAALIYKKIEHKIDPKSLFSKIYQKLKKVRK
jgi:hypothetical protein